MFITAGARGQEVTGESAATLPETIAWLKSVINNQNPLEHFARNTGNDETYKLEFVDFANGELRYRETFTAQAGRPYGDGKKSYYILTSIPLQGVDRLTVKAVQNTTSGYWMVEFRANGEKQVISQTSDVTRENGQKLNHNRMHFGNQAIAQRVAQALQHAIKLSGGKVDPF